MALAERGGGVQVMAKTVLHLAIWWPLLSAGPTALQGSETFHLPFPPGVAYRVICGPGDGPHHLSPRNRHAVDFDMSYGSEVSAAASGRVILTENRFEGPTGRSEDNNYIAIEHASGLVSEYHHLMQDGVLVRPGEWVERGEVLGFSGTSGRTEGAHLHFVVLRAEESQPVEFAECGKPKRGDLCLSENAPADLSACYRDLKRARQGGTLLLALGQLVPARLLFDLVLRDAESPGRTVAERRRQWALRPLEGALRDFVLELERQDSLSAQEHPRAQYLAIGGQR